MKQCVFGVNDFGILRKYSIKFVRVWFYFIYLHDRF